MQIAKSSGHHMARLNRLIQLTLVTGLSVSMLLMLIGTALFIFHPQAGGTAPFAAVHLLPGLAAGNPLAFMVAGMIVLMVTPAVRVGVAALGYVLEGDWTFALISLGVLTVLAVSVLIGAV